MKYSETDIYHKRNYCCGCCCCGWSRTPTSTTTPPLSLAITVENDAPMMSDNDY